MPTAAPMIKPQSRLQHRRLKCVYPRFAPAVVSPVFVDETEFNGCFNGRLYMGRFFPSSGFGYVQSIPEHHPRAVRVGFPDNLGDQGNIKGWHVPPP